MGGITSIFFSSNNDNDDQATLSELLDGHPVNWDVISRYLRNNPDEAGAYCFGVERSPLHVALTIRYPNPPPLHVVRAFVDAYDDAARVPDASAGETLVHAYLRNNVTSSSEDVGEVVRLLLQYHPEAVMSGIRGDNDARGGGRGGSVDDEDGRRRRTLPLHLVRHGDAAGVLLRDYPDGIGIREPRHGRLPLHCAAISVGISVGNGGTEGLLPSGVISSDVVRTLVRAGRERLGSELAGGVLVPDDDKKTPLQLLCDDIALTFQREHHPDDTDDESGEQSSERRGRLLPLCPRGERLWEALLAMVEEAAAPSNPLDGCGKKCSDDDGGKTKSSSVKMVHTLVEWGCPAIVIAQALRSYPDEARERDARGRTPLMIAVSTPNSTMNSDVIYELVQNADGYGYPEAARMTDADGRLPIDLAAENLMRVGRTASSSGGGSRNGSPPSSSSSIRAQQQQQSPMYEDEVWNVLVRAEPRAIDTRDLRDKLFPFMTASIGEDSNVNVAYRLLRDKPHVMGYFDLK